MSCEHAEQVHAFHDDQLSPGQRLVFGVHLENCPECSELLGKMRSLSKLIVAAPLPQLSDASNARYYEVWNVAQHQRGVLRIASWLTSAAAAALIGSLLLWPKHDTDNANVRSETGAPWETVALMPPSAERVHDRPDETIEIAQWMADELSSDAMK